MVDTVRYQFNQGYQALPVFFRANATNSFQRVQKRIVNHTKTQNQGQPQCATRQGGGPVEVFMVSLLMKTGYGPAFKWISDILKAKK